MKAVYFCTGGCKGESDKPGACQTKDCAKHGHTLTESFKCGECGMHYSDEKMAKNCEDFCKEHNACNVEYIKLALENQ